LGKCGVCFLRMIRGGPTDALWDGTLESVLVSARRAREGAHEQGLGAGPANPPAARLANLAAQLDAAQEEFRVQTALRRERDRLRQEMFDSSDDEVDPDEP
jgi:hypothetical protein